MVEEHLASLTVNLLATGIAAGTSVAVGEVRDRFRERRVSEDLDDVATEFQVAFREAIDETDAERDTGELAGVTDDWGAVVDELGQRAGPASGASAREREGLEVLFADEREAVERVAAAIAAAEGFDLSRTPDLRADLQDAVTVAYRRAVARF